MRAFSKWEILIKKAETFRKQGQYEKAVKVVKKALKVAVENFRSRPSRCGDLPEQSGGTLQRSGQA